MAEYSFVLLFLVVVLAFSIQTTTGFGSTVISLGLGIYLFPLKELVPVLVMVGILQCLFLVVRGFRQINYRELFGRILLFCGLGLPVGIWFFRRFETEQLKLLLGAFIVVAAAAQLFAMRDKDAELKPLPIWLGWPALVLGGFIHGIFASGGPLVVLYAGRQLTDKSVFRATLSAVWLLLDLVLLVSFIWQDRITGANLKMAGILVPGLLLGILAGELIHHRVNERIFRLAVYIVLLLTGVFILIR